MQKIKKWLPIFAVGFAVLSIVFLALPAFTFKEVEDNGYTSGASAKGFSLIFGGDMIYKSSFGVFSHTESDAYFGFSLLNFCAFLFIIVATILVIFGNKAKNKKLIKVFSSILFVAAAILFFCLVDNFEFDKNAGEFESYDKMDFVIEKKQLLNSVKLGVGSILPAICSILASVLVLLECFFDRIIQSIKERA